MFNPSTVHRLVHVWIGCFIMGAFFVMSISAWYLLKRRHEEFARRSFTGALMLATAREPGRAGQRDTSRPRTSTAQQPAKIAAFEGHFDDRPGRPDPVRHSRTRKRGRLRWNVAIPGGLSFLLHGDSDEPVLGLDRFRPEDRPPVLIPFFSYHVMIGLGTFFIALTLLASFLRWRGTLFETRWLLWVFVFAVLGAVAANQLGWVAAEVGRQPWIVHPPLVRGRRRRAAARRGGVHPLRDGHASLAWPTAPSSNVRRGLTHDRRRSARSVTRRAGARLDRAVRPDLPAALALWIFVLNHKIQHGPMPPRGGGSTAGGLLDAAGDVGRRHRVSMTDDERRVGRPWTSI